MLLLIKEKLYYYNNSALNDKEVIINVIHILAILLYPLLHRSLQALIGFGSFLLPLLYQCTITLCDLSLLILQAALYSFRIGTFLFLSLPGSRP